LSGFCDGCGRGLERAEAPSPPERDPHSYTPKHLAETDVSTRRDLPDSFASGRYRVERFLGEGAKKRVYLARDTRLDRDVAVAVIKTEGLDTEVRLRVQREAQAMGRLGDHPNIVTIHDVSEDGDRLFMVAQYMGGGDLEARVNEVPDHRLPIEEAVRIGDELCRALEHAHGSGIVHRDLKPGNVYLGDDGGVRLGDFGLAVALDRTRITQEGMMVGTVAYMPPEQALGRAADARSDLYAVGAVLYELVSGRPPFVGDDAVAIISQHINTPPVAPSWHNKQIPKRLEALILKLLTKDPEGRPASAAEVRQALGTITSGPDETISGAEPIAANPLDRLAEGVFVGREAEIETLRRGVDDALSGRGRVLFVVGEPGIGKTRTSEELTTYARMRGAQVLWGRCYEGEGAPAYWPWVQIIRAYVHDREPKSLMSEMGPGAAEIAEIVSDVRERLPGLPKAPELEPEQARFRLFDSITAFVRNASQEEPLVLIVDDLHWADRPSLLLLQFLARELGPSRVLILGTYRDVELGRQHPLEQTLAELARAHLSDRVLLRGLTGTDVSRFIELTSNRPPPRSLVEAVYRETEGNPFFVHEVVQLLQSDGRLDRPEEVESWSLEIPQGVRQVIGRRLSALSEECNAVLAIASVIGREFDLPILSIVADPSEDRVLELIEAAEDARIVGEVPDQTGRYRFSHALIRETLYEEIRTTRRLRLHRRVAEAIEELHAGKLEPRMDELAYHFCEAASVGDVERAVGYAERAAERATGLLAYEEAANHYDRALTALEAAEPVDERRRCELLIALGTAQFRSGAADQYRQTFLRAIEIARKLGLAGPFAHAALGMGSAWFGSPSYIDEELVRIFEEALELLPDEDSALRARIMARLGSELLWEDSPERRHSLWRAAIEMARRIGDRDALARTLTVGVIFLPRWKEPRSGLAMTDEIIALAQESGDRGAEFEGRSARIGYLVELGEADDFDHELEAKSRLAEELRQPMAMASAAQSRACRALWQGDLDEARREAWEGRVHGLRVDPEYARQTYGVQHYARRRMQGRLGAELPFLRAGVERFPGAVIWQGLLAYACAESGELAEARSVFEKLAENDFAFLDRDASARADLAFLADVCSALRDTKRAPILYERLRSFGGRYLFLLPLAIVGSAPRALGQLAATMQRYDDAARHFEEAIEVDRQMRALGWLPRTQCDYARMLVERDAPGDREKALELLGEALETSQELGLTAWLDMALELKLQVQGVDSSDTKSSISLVMASVDAKRPDLSPHAATDGTVTLMFSDMVNFTAMTERLGDRKAHEIVGAHNALVREQCASHGGSEIELQGDGFLLAFPTAQQGLRCAIQIQRGFAAYNWEHSEEPIHVRIGLHTGAAIKDADRFFGLSVILAARIAALAKGEQILVSSTVKALTDRDPDVRFDEGREVELKGLAGTYRVLGVGWE
jgi:class 3 adenylate cyclase